MPGRSPVIHETQQTAGCAVGLEQLVGEIGDLRTEQRARWTERTARLSMGVAIVSLLVSLVSLIVSVEG